MDEKKLTWSQVHRLIVSRFSNCPGVSGIGHTPNVGIYIFMEDPDKNNVRGAITDLCATHGAPVEFKNKKEAPFLR